MPSRCRPLLGTFVEVTADHEPAIDAAFEAISQVHRLMSTHDVDSDVSRINRFGHLRPVEVHDWTARVIERALFWSKESAGAFDVVRAGKDAVERERIPRHRDQPMPQASHWTWLEAQGACMRLLRAGCIDLGGIAKGFAVDRAVAALRAAGCASGLVNAGGDLRAFGPGSWPVEIVHPLTRRAIVTVEVDNEALATSAGLPDAAGRLTFEHLDGGAPEWVSVSVLARSACDADAMTKILWISAASARCALAATGAKALAITAHGAVEEIRGEELVAA